MSLKDLFRNRESFKHSPPKSADEVAREVEESSEYIEKIGTVSSLRLTTVILPNLLDMVQQKNIMRTQLKESTARTHMMVHFVKYWNGITHLLL